MQFCELNEVKPLQNKERITSKWPINEITIGRMVRATKVPTPKVGTKKKEEKGKAKVDAATENVPTSDEVWTKVLAIKYKLNALTRTLGRVATTVKKLDLAHNLFYAYVKTWKKFALAAKSRITLVALSKFLEFPPIICSYDFISNLVTK
ncbi:hypothetical protein V6N13_030089 [Hibiscus sabdariffa]|uniref:Uncharacterized protein n=2 Tax=Hibiscus sabdariffa TaxID=183260 RepID=A0ABR2T8V0_9ROSI